MKSTHATVALVLALSGQFAFGQSAGAPGAPAPVAKEEAVQLPAFEIKADSDTGYVGKSSLSSTRIAVDLADLPQSVKVLNASFLAAVNPYALMDILNYVGGAQSGQINWNPGRLNIRGFTGDGDYNDGFAPSAAVAIDSALYDRFEVIKGPSTVFLAADGTPGGVVNKITKSPRSVASTSLTLQVGRFDADSVHLDTTGPITADKKLLYRIVAGQQYSTGYYDNFYLHRFVVMPQLSYTFNENTKLVLKALLVEAAAGVYNGLPIDPRTYQMFAVPYTRSMEENAPYNWKHDQQDRLWGTFTSRLNEHVALHVGAMWAYNRRTRVESIATTWNEGKGAWVVPNYDGSQSFPRATQADDVRQGYRDLQTDLNLNFRLGPTSNNLLVGSELREDPNTNTTYAGSTSSWNPFIKVPPTVTVNYSTPSAKVENGSKNARGFVLETMKLFGDRLILSAGVARVRGLASSRDMLTGVYKTPEYTLYKNLKQYGVVYKLVPGINLFSGYNENFALNGVGVVNGVTGALPPKVGKQTEVGTKTELLHGKLLINVSYFDIKQTNNTVPSAPLDPLNPQVLIPGVISRGFDGDFTFNATRHLYLIGSFSAYRAKSVLGPQGLRVVQPYYGRIITGSLPVDNTAEHAYSAFGVYRFTEGPWANLSVGLGANYLSKRAITDGPNQVMFGYISGRTLVNLNATYKMGKHVKYNLNVDNLLNAKYIQAVRSENVIIPGVPTNVKLSVEYTF